MSKDTFFKRQTSDQPGWAKGIQNTVIVLGAALAAYLIYRNAQRKKDLQQAGQGASAAEQALAKLAKQGVYPTYDDSVYFGWVDTLVQAMNGCGTDEDSIYSIFHQLENEADVLKLVAVFKVQYYEPCGWSNPLAYAKWEIDDKSYGGELTTWFGYDLETSEIQKINDILASKDIKYRF